MVVFVIISQCVWSWMERRGEYEGSRVEGNGYPFCLSYFNVLKSSGGTVCVHTPSHLCLDVNGKQRW